MKKIKAVLLALLLVLLLVMGIWLGSMMTEDQNEWDGYSLRFAEGEIPLPPSATDESNPYLSEDDWPSENWDEEEWNEPDSEEEFTYEEEEAWTEEESETVPDFIPEAEPSKEPEETQAPSEPEPVEEGMKWQDVFIFPSAEAIANHNAQDTPLAPYIAGWMQIPDKTRYSEYMIDFKAEYLPNATYCCLSNWKMDYSSLEKEYASVRTEYPSVQGYAGFQSLLDGQRVSIMSFWDIFCTDSSGNETTIRAKLVYPEPTDNDSFGGEGTGAHCIVPYDWQEDHWYRMHLICTEYETGGNTIVEQWVCDLETMEETLLCAYDTGVKDSCFIGSTAIFLENFISSVAGEVRTMEVRNPKYRREYTGDWRDIPSAYLMPNGGMPKYCGDYNFGVTGDTYWMITSGVGGDWYGNPSSSKGGTFQATKK